MEGKLQNKIIVIIGGTAGIGLSAARACLAEAARVVTVGRDPSVERLLGHGGARTPFALAAARRDSGMDRRDHGLGRAIFASARRHLRGPPLHLRRSTAFYAAP